MSTCALSAVNIQQYKNSLFYMKGIKVECYYFGAISIKRNK